MYFVSILPLDRLFVNLKFKICILSLLFSPLAPLFFPIFFSFFHLLQTVSNDKVLLAAQPGQHFTISLFSILWFALVPPPPSPHLASVLFSGLCKLFMQFILPKQPFSVQGNTQRREGPSCLDLSQQHLLLTLSRAQQAFIVVLHFTFYIPLFH